MRVRGVAVLIVVGALWFPSSGQGAGYTGLRLCAGPDDCSWIADPAPIGIPTVASQAHGLVAVLCFAGTTTPIAGGEVRTCQYSGTGRNGNRLETVGASGQAELSVTSTDSPFHHYPTNADSVTVNDQTIQLVTGCTKWYTEPDNPGCVH